MSRHTFICPRCGEPTREIFDVYCLQCCEIIEQREEPEAHYLVHLASEFAAPVSGHPGTV